MNEKQKERTKQRPKKKKKKKKFRKSEGLRLERSRVAGRVGRELSV